MYTTARQIEEIVQTTKPRVHGRNEFVLRESLRALVRLAQKEYELELRKSVSLATGEKISATDKKRAKAEIKRIQAGSLNLQGQLKF
ncbi:hypothetical protein [Massilia sp. BSC265]|uniref:hypothetical protein n=1 Tax=Massilia sp. BSC265 TaxID=1549812 RepID=UPI00126A7A4F|nr:hypothetical protein [Massilia sp. BSC265]